jgi:two-component system, OmpR family, sensor histidine kinase KdpD
MDPEMTSRGKLRTYVGIAPGVGKTYAMLRDARARRRAGADTVVANLAALRELAQLWLDDSVPDPVAAYAAAHGIREQVQASVIMVGLEGSPADEWLIRYAARLAGLSDARLQAVYVRAYDLLDQPPAERLEKDRRLLDELGGTLLEVRADDPASGLIQAARQAGACQLVIGSRRRSPWSRLLGGSRVADQVLRAAGDLPVQVVNVGQPS